MQKEQVGVVLCSIHLMDEFHAVLFTALEESSARSLGNVFAVVRIHVLSILQDRQTGEDQRGTDGGPFEKLEGSGQGFLRHAVMQAHSFRQAFVELNEVFIKQLKEFLPPRRCIGPGPHLQLPQVLGFCFQKSDLVLIEITLEIHQEVSCKDRHGHHHDADAKEDDETTHRLPSPGEIAKDPLAIQVERGGPNRPHH